MRHCASAIWRTSSNSRELAGWISASRAESWRSKSAGSSPGRTVSRARSPCLRAFFATRDLPSSVRGPVDFLALLRLAFICAFVVMIIIPFVGAVAPIPGYGGVAGFLECRWNKSRGMKEMSFWKWRDWWCCLVTGARRQGRPALTPPQAPLCRWERPSAGNNPRFVERRCQP